jgi:hypothetical protein
MNEEENKREKKENSPGLDIKGSMNETLEPNGQIFTRILMQYLPWTLAAIFFTLYVWGLGTSGAEERNRQSYERLHDLLSEQGPDETALVRKLDYIGDLLEELEEQESKALEAQNTSLNLLLSDKDLSYLPKEPDSLASKVQLWADYQRNILYPRERELQARQNKLEQSQAALRSQIVTLARDLYFSSGLDSSRKEPVISSDEAFGLIPLSRREDFTEDDVQRFYRMVLTSFTETHRSSLERLLRDEAFRQILIDEGVSISGTKENFSITFWPGNLSG